MKRFLFLAFLLLTSAAQAGESLKPPWSLAYSDGSANRYRFGQDTKGGETQFEYLPIRPEESSTGTYSGGEARQGRLDAKQTAQLQQWLGKLEKNKALHTADRAKGTGAFTLNSGDETRSFIIQDSPELRDFNEFLKKL
ncbi:MAG TPA: hypothetical protein VJR29_08980 [bacterium]|nr:hypothetical protein [bacterium]